MHGTEFLYITETLCESFSDIRNKSRFYFLYEKMLLLLISEINDFCHLRLHRLEASKRLSDKNSFTDIKNKHF